MISLCKNCGNSFEISDADQEFYKKVNVLAPTFCPDCRQFRRLVWRNERTLYSRNCNLCNKKIISIYPAQTTFPVYCNACWWSDKWEPLAFGQDFDFNKPFFEQYKALQDKVPRLALYQKNAQNSDYTNHCENLKNCYMSVDIANSENVYYSKWIVDGGKDVCDCYQMEKPQLCYESLYSDVDYNCIYIYLSNNCLDSAFLFDCTGCSECFMCWNLRHKQYFIQNKQYSKEEYEKFMESIDLGSFSKLQQYRSEFLKILDQQAIRKHQNITFSENCSGDFIYKCKNVHDSYDVIESEDCKFCYDSGYLKDCYDTFEAAFNCELQCDCHACNRGTNIKFCHVSYDIDSSCYTDSCHDSSDLFGCISLRRKKYCILNKQYSKEEYEDLVKRIIERVKGTGEYGEFFPAFLSPFAYNETLAQEYFPMTKEEVEGKGFKWANESVGTGRDLFLQWDRIPDNIKDTPDSIVNEILSCTDCNKNYKIIPQELKFYHQMNVPIPRKCPKCRHKDRMAIRNPRRLWKQNCKKCGTEIFAPYAAGGCELVYCAKCYKAEIY